MYDASLGEIARKNFVAGFSHALGGFMVTVVTWLVIALIVIKFIFPYINSTFAQFNGLFDRLGKLQGIGTSQNSKGPTIQIPDSILKQFETTQPIQ